MCVNYTGRCWLLCEMAGGGKVLLVGGLESILACELMVRLGTTPEDGCYNITF